MNGLRVFVLTSLALAAAAGLAVLAFGDRGPDCADYRFDQQRWNAARTVDSGLSEDAWTEIGEGIATCGPLDGRARGAVRALLSEPYLTTRDERGRLEWTYLLGRESRPGPSGAVTLVFAADGTVRESHFGVSSD